MLVWPVEAEGCVALANPTEALHQRLDGSASLWQEGFTRT